MSNKKSIFIAATAQHVGKTTTCLGIVSGLQKRFANVGFIKPVGQRHVETDCGYAVDKDVVLFKERFGLTTPYPDMSPVIMPSGFTRSYLDGEVSREGLKKKIHEAYERVHTNHEYTVVEGTGHSGVGSIIDMNNADVAADLGLEVILVTTGGVGNAFDQLALNWEMMKSKGVKVRAIILNKVIDKKREMVLEYVPKALKKWGVPLAGCIPYCELLDAPTMRDYEQLFQVPMIAGEEHRYRHFLHDRLIVTTAQAGLHSSQPSELVITHAQREDIIRATIEDEFASRNHPDGDLERGMILVGHIEPSKTILDEIKKAEIPTIYAPISSYKAMEMIARFTAKIRREDTHKVDKAIEIVEENIDFEVLCQ